MLIPINNYFSFLSFKNQSPVNNNRFQFASSLPSEYDALKIKDPEKKIRALIAVAQNEQNIGRYPQSLSLFEKVLDIQREIYRNNPNHEDIAITYSYIGALWYIMGYDEKSLRAHEEALRIRKNNKEKPLIAKSLESIGVVLRRQGNWQGALDKFKEALQLRLDSRDELAIAESYYDIGTAYRDGEYYNEAYENFHKADEIRVTYYGQDLSIDKVREVKQALNQLKALGYS